MSKTPFSPSSLSSSSTSGGRTRTKASAHNSKSPISNSQSPVSPPLATYRLQFNRDFTLKQATALLDYLHDLGISDCYASPLFKAGAQSTHGYDICAFDQINPNLGTPADFEEFASSLKRLGLGLLLDMVPNHMRADSSNCWWWDVLEKGPASRFASWFDIDWRPLQSDLHDKVLLPVLEDHYAKVLEAGKLSVLGAGTSSSPNQWVLAYHDRRFPLSHVECSQGPPLPEGRDAFHRVPDQKARGRGGTRPYHLDEEAHGGERFVLAPSSTAALDSLLRRQHYRLAFWRVAGEEINYRRFFDVTELVSLRMDLPEVFEAAHRFLFSLLDTGKVTGLRIDHPDGLWNPRQYFERLRQHRRTYVVVEKILTDGELLPLDWPVQGTTGYDFLNRVNRLFVNPANRQALDSIYRDFLGNAYEADFKTVIRSSKLKVLLHSFAGELNALTHRLKRLAAGTRPGQDLTFSQLRQVLAEVIAAFPVYRSYIAEDPTEIAAPSRHHIQEAIRAARSNAPALDPMAFALLESVLLLHSPSSSSSSSFSPSSSMAHDFIMRFQQLTGPVMAKGLEDTAFYTYNRLLSLNEVGGDPDAFGTSLQDYHQRVLDSMRWPHSMLATATHDTKRGEDARARINLLSEMPEGWRDAVTRWAAMNADKKTLVDGQPAPSANDEYLLYQTLVGAWSSEADTPDGARHLADRIAAYMLKATREAKTHTSWLDPNPDYEEATRRFVQRLCTKQSKIQAPDSDRASPHPPPEARPLAFGRSDSGGTLVVSRRAREESHTTFPGDFKNFHRKLAYFSPFNSLSQVLMKLTSPGVPDFYQGTELWDLSLVDPDNRRAVDYGIRRRLLRDLKHKWPPSPGKAPEFFHELLRTSETGRLKLLLIWRALQFRRAHRELFESGNYIPLFATGPKKKHVCAFARAFRGQQVIVVVPRLVLALLDGIERPPLCREVWQDTELPLPDTKPGSRFRNALTGEELTAGKPDAQLKVHQALRLFPVALLERTS